MNENDKPLPGQQSALADSPVHGNRQCEDEAPLGGTGVQGHPWLQS